MTTKPTDSPSPKDSPNDPAKDPDPSIAAQNATQATGDETLGETAKTILIAIILALLVRTFLFEPFNIPSSSMVPNLLVGDYIFTSKYSYGYSQYSLPFGVANFQGRFMEKKPKQGDIVVFRQPTHTDIDFIKRLIGMPGDKIQMINGRLYINDEIVQREYVGQKLYKNEHDMSFNMSKYIETLPNGVKHVIYEKSDNDRLDNTAQYVVPPNHYFMMGDNRDDSNDSRVLDEVGYVPFDNLVGRAELIFFSTNGKARLWEMWKWPWTIRYDRLFESLRAE